MRSSYNGGAMGGRAAGTGGSGKSAAPVDKEVDYAQYFCTYSFLYHQKDMLSDRVRMDAYFNAVVENKHHFAGKTVLDVGTGSGILAIWSAQAGAKKVLKSYKDLLKMSHCQRKMLQEGSDRRRRRGASSSDANCGFHVS